jgi:hypothetical protein
MLPLSDPVRPFGQGAEFRAQVGIVQESVFAVADVYKSSIQPGHHLPDFADENIAYREVVVGFLMVEFGEFAVLNECEFNARFGRVDD